MAEHADDREQRTEEATPRKREESRKEGQVALSQELVSVLMLCAGAAALLAGGPRLVEATGGLVARSIERLGTAPLSDWGPADAAAACIEAVLAVAGGLAIAVAPILAVGFVAAYGQVGFQVAPEAIGLRFSRLDPMSNLRRILGLRGLTRLGFGLGHVVVLVIVAGACLWREIGALAALAGSEPGPFLLELGRITLRVAAAALIVALALALADLFYQRWQLSRDLRMTKQEIKEELRSSEGDPHVKARVRTIQRELARRRMMADVPRSTVVVTNPTHVAVALSYPRDEQGEPLYGAPRVAAKGLDLTAERIKQLAREAGVVCYEDVSLARSLYRQAEIGQEIPEDLYAAVAEVLNYVYRLQGTRVPEPAGEPA